MRWLAFVSLFLASSADASPPAVTVRVQVEGSENLTFNHLAQNTLSVQTPWGTQQAVFSGAPYTPDPQHYWRHLFPLTLQLKMPANTQAGRYPVRATAQLYLCDQRAHVCTVRTAETDGELTVRQPLARIELLLKLKVPVFNFGPQRT